MLTSSKYARYAEHTEMEFLFCGGINKCRKEKQYRQQGKGGGAEIQVKKVFKCSLGKRVAGYFDRRHHSKVPFSRIVFIYSERNKGGDIAGAKQELADKPVLFEQEFIIL